MTVGELCKILSCLSEDLEIVKEDKHGKEPATSVVIFLDTEGDTKLIIE